MLILTIATLCMEPLALIVQDLKSHHRKPVNLALALVWCTALLNWSADFRTSAALSEGRFWDTPHSENQLPAFTGFRILINHTRFPTACRYDFWERCNLYGCLHVCKMILMSGMLRSGCCLISGLWCRMIGLLAPMESAGKVLICDTSSKDK